MVILKKKKRRLYFKSDPCVTFHLDVGVFLFKQEGRQNRIRELNSGILDHLDLYDVLGDGFF